MLDTIFLDGLYNDLERLTRINHLLSLHHDEVWDRNAQRQAEADRPARHRAEPATFARSPCAMPGTFRARCGCCCVARARGARAAAS